MQADGRTPAYIAAAKGHLAVIDRLVDAKCNVNQADVRDLPLPPSPSFFPSLPPSFFPFLPPIPPSLAPLIFCGGLGVSGLRGDDEEEERVGGGGWRGVGALTGGARAA